MVIFRLFSSKSTKHGQKLVHFELHFLPLLWSMILFYCNVYVTVTIKLYFISLSGTRYRKLNNGRQEEKLIFILGNKLPTIYDVAVSIYSSTNKKRNSDGICDCIN